MKLSFELENTPERNDMLENHQLVVIKAQHSNKKVETFVESIGDLVDIDFFNTRISCMVAYNRLVAMRKQKVLQ
jgi:hypothetical protein